MGQRGSPGLLDAKGQPFPTAPPGPRGLALPVHPPTVYGAQWRGSPTLWARGFWVPCARGTPNFLTQPVLRRYSQPSKGLPPRDLEPWAHSKDIVPPPGLPRSRCYRGTSGRVLPSRRVAPAARHCVLRAERAAEARRAGVCGLAHGTCLSAYVLDMPRS